MSESSDSDVFVSEKLDRAQYAPAAGLNVQLDDSALSQKELMFQIVELRTQSENQAQLIASLHEQLHHKSRLVETYTKENMRLRKENEMKTDQVREARLKKLDSSSISISSRIRAAKGSEEGSKRGARSLSDRVATLRSAKEKREHVKRTNGPSTAKTGEAGKLSSGSR